MRQYQTDYSNQVHQLIISVSKHLWVSKDNRLLHQKKPFDVDLRTLNKAVKEHVVHYLLTDHFSGALYGETCTVSSMIHPGEFLHRAWSQKEDYVFCGLPEMLTVPQSAIEMFPQMINLLAAMEVKIAKVTSGFQGGIRTIRTWEDRLLYESWEGTSPSPGEIVHRQLKFPQVQEKTLRMSIRLSHGFMDKYPKINKWKSTIEKVYLPPRLKEFLSFYA